MYGIKWKRNAKQTGRINFGYQNDKRAYNAKYGKEEIGWVYNPSAHWSGTEDVWKMAMYASGSNLMFKKTFTSPEDAMNHFEQLWFKIQTAKEGQEPYFTYQQKIGKIIQL